MSILPSAEPGSLQDSTADAAPSPTEIHDSSEGSLLDNEEVAGLDEVLREAALRGSTVRTPR
jgi:hypothetical protein